MSDSCACEPSFSSAVPSGGTDKRPRPARFHHLPAWIARLVAGEHMVAMMTQARAGSNIKAKRDLDWQLVHPSWREGFAVIARQAPAQKSAA